MNGTRDPVGGRVAVVGAGPAGCAAALELARHGIAVDLYRPARTGEKPCGGGVATAFLPSLPRLSWEAIDSVEVTEALLESEHGMAVTLPLSGLSVFRRRDLDAALERAAAVAGARVVSEKVAGVDTRDGLVWVQAGGATESYSWAVGADGIRGPTRRLLELSRQEESPAIGASLVGVRCDRAVLAFPGLGDAYAWIFPRPGGVSVGITHSPGLLSEGAARLLLDRLLRRHLGVADLRSAPQGPRYRYPIPVWGPASIAAVGAALERKLLLVGDAAGVADPLTREGIRWAVRSGQVAARCLVEGRPEQYPVHLSAALAPELDRARRAREWFFEGGLAQGMVLLSAFHRPVRQVAADLLACRQGYRGLRRRLLRALLYRDPVGRGAGTEPARLGQVA